MDGRPVLYLDIDDTLLTYRNGYPEAAPGAREFLGWALGRFEVRWLTKWCPAGEMPQKLLDDFCRMIPVEREVLESIRGFSWEFSASKSDGLAWLEHLVLERSFLWIEDDYGFGDFERQLLAQLGLLENYRHCNVTENPQALVELHADLEAQFEAGDERVLADGAARAA